MDMKGKICPYCKTALDDSETIVVCDTCDMPHHLTCWQENQGCTTFGCTGAIGAIIDGNKQKSHPTERLGTMPQSREPAGAICNNTVFK